MSKLDEILRSRGVLPATAATPATRQPAPAPKVARVATVARSTPANPISREPVPPAGAGGYTRCLDCIHYTAPPPDTAFWCPLVKGRPTVALWAICTAYAAKPFTPTPEKSS